MHRLCSLIQLFNCRSNISKSAGEILARYFAVTCVEGDALPEAVGQWLETESRIIPERPLRLAQRIIRDVFSVEKEGKCLTIKLMRDFTSDECILVMSESNPAVLFQNLQRYGLSAREIEVVCWLDKGKTNVEIAVILGISKRTADKHLEHVFAKFGVETRAAAVAIVRNESTIT